ncbi:hypothetical protein Tco_1201748 [Tanacetum coccineum]
MRADAVVRSCDTVMVHMTMEILLEPTSNSSAVGSYALSWKPYQGDSSKLNLPDHSFQNDAKYEHVGQGTRSQGGKDLKEKDLKKSESKTKSKDNDKGYRSKITQHEGTSLQHDKDQRFKNSTTKQSQQVQGSKNQDLTSKIRRPHIRGDC